MINANEINPGSDNWLAFRPRINWTSSQTKSNQDHWANLAITHTRDWWYLNQRLSYNLVSTRHPSHKGTLCDSPYVPHRRLVPIRHEDPHHLPIAQWWNQPEQGEKINHLDPRSRHIKRRWLNQPFYTTFQQSEVWFGREKHQTVNRVIKIYLEFQRYIDHVKLELMSTNMIRWTKCSNIHVSFKHVWPNSVQK